jgi:hypothetical protein
MCTDFGRDLWLDITMSQNNRAEAVSFGAFRDSAIIFKIVPDDVPEVGINDIERRHLVGG